ncbi:DUF599 family protein [Zooshikella marina]|uniref:DUF599 domain-containing protein n=1 Tax=Zooshikella ganghwensis TaxID=202772 RepID=UPI001BAEA8BA|nr:DUF599 family protein [Zooshikella ganghwensis]MBU2706776.1 DUF599 family protein [Zooshikella ganghwensis]
MLWDVVALIWLLLAWVGYSFFAKYQGRRQQCLAKVLHHYRQQWATRILLRENRIGDASITANLERNVTFFASTSILVVAGLVTAFTATEHAILVLSDLPWVSAPSRKAWELKIMVLLVIFVYAFFTFTWSLRQYNFASVLLGSAPLPSEQDVSDQERSNYGLRLAKVLSLAANRFNYGLRAFYFGLATLAWFLNPWFYMLATILVVIILYQREFHSTVLKAMVITPLKAKVSVSPEH